MMEKVHRPATWFKVMCWVLAVLCAVVVVLLPGTIAMIWLVLKARIVVKEEGIQVTWFGTRDIPWTSISKLEWGRAGGAIGAAMRPLTYTLTAGGTGNIAVGAFENHQEILQALKDKTGHSP